jgi:hypothetical protein
VKPHIVVTHGGFICTSRFYGIVGHSHLAWGMGETPIAAYEAWSNHWGIKK